MNRQRNNKGGRGIEWTDYTWNPVAGCLHGCRWEMPDGSIAECYAETVANKFTQHYPEGFEHHYFHPQRLSEPAGAPRGSKVFLDSMADLMGAWVPDREIEQVLEVIWYNQYLTFQLLTKNAPRLLQFKFPPNLWVGVSAPPTFFKGKRLSHAQQLRMLGRSLDVLSKVRARVKWMSIEPLSWDIAPDIGDSHPLNWAVIGAATNGPRVYAPDDLWVRDAVLLFDLTKTPVFFKGNLDSVEWARENWREEFPAA